MNFLGKFLGSLGKGLYVISIFLFFKPGHGYDDQSNSSCFRTLGNLKMHVASAFSHLTKKNVSTFNMQTMSLGTRETPGN